VESGLVPAEQITRLRRGRSRPLLSSFKDGSRAEVIEKYETWLMSQPQLLSKLHDLRGKNLVCWCAPQACHADVLLRLANKSCC
jgi:hypothetical protein